MSKRILVTGGAGFIGSHLCKRLVDEGQQVYCLDNLFTGSRRNITSLLDKENFEFIRHDVVQPYELDVDEIYNLACPASPVHYQYNPIKTMKIGFLGMMNVLDLAVRSGAKVLQASTSEVYGDPLVHPQPENYWGHVNPIGIRSCYDEGKRAAETLCFDYRRHYNLDVKVVRIFNTYGPNMHPQDGRVVSNFIVQALQNKPITIFGDGSQTRSFCYVDDLVEGMWRMMQTSQEVSGPINLGNPGEFSMLELAKIVIGLTHSKFEITYQQLPQDDPRQRKPDITLAKNMLGWAPRVQLTEGLDQTIYYFSQLLAEQCQGKMC